MYAVDFNDGRSRYEEVPGSRLRLTSAAELEDNYTGKAEKEKKAEMLAAAVREGFHATVGTGLFGADEEGEGDASAGDAPVVSVHAGEWTFFDEEAVQKMQDLVATRLVDECGDQEVAYAVAMSNKRFANTNASSTVDGTTMEVSPSAQMILDLQLGFAIDDVVAALETANGDENNAMLALFLGQENEANERAIQEVLAADKAAFDAMEAEVATAEQAADVQTAAAKAAFEAGEAEHAATEAAQFAAKEAELRAAEGADAHEAKVQALEAEKEAANAQRAAAADINRAEAVRSVQAAKEDRQKLAAERKAVARFAADEKAAATETDTEEKKDAVTKAANEKAAKAHSAVTKRRQSVAVVGTKSTSSAFSDDTLLPNMYGCYCVILMTLFLLEEDGRLDHSSPNKSTCKFEHMRDPTLTVGGNVPRLKY
jgi:hypothetical protein